jgi:hypothetical protein
MTGAQLIGFTGVVGGLIVAVTAVVMSLWTGVRLAEFRARRVELEIGLKRDMVGRGMSVEEIERVIAAGPPKAPPSSTDSAPVPGSAVRKACI